MVLCTFFGVFFIYIIELYKVMHLSFDMQCFKILKELKDVRYDLVNWEGGGYTDFYTPHNELRRV